MFIILMIIYYNECKSCALIQVLEICVERKLGFIWIFCCCNERATNCDAQNNNVGNDNNQNNKKY